MSKSVSRIYRRVMKRLKFAAPHIDGFKEWLREAGYRAPTIEELVRLLAGWTDWMSASGFTLGDVPAGFEASAAFVKDKKRIRCPGDISQPSLGAARVL